MPSKRIVDASPLILLSKAGLLELLRLDGVKVVVPEVVLGEIQAKGPHDPVALAVARADWLILAPDPPTPEPIKAFRLDPGESAVLSLAMGDPGSVVVLDDLAGRKCAKRLGVPCLGTLGLVLFAKSLGRIELARPLIAQLQSVGLYLEADFVEEVLRRVGE